MRLRAWLDRTPVASVALALMRDATGRETPLEPLRPTRPAALPGGVTAFWALQAGVGASTVAALTAQRSAAAGHPGVLIDLDRWAPSLALRAETTGATVEDALLHPGAEGSLVSRWARPRFCPGARIFIGPSTGRGSRTSFVRSPPAGPRSSISAPVRMRSIRRSSTRSSAFAS